MNEEFKVEIVNPDKSFYSNESVREAVVPAFEGEMGILKDHISIISFLKPGIITILNNSSEEKFYVEDGILEFKDNVLSILTSSIYNIKNIQKDKISIDITEAEKALKNPDLNDEGRYLISQKIDVLKTIN